MKRVIKIYLSIDDTVPESDIAMMLYTYQELKEAIKRKDNIIVTTQTHAFTSWLYKTDEEQEHLYDDIILINGQQQLSIKDVLSGKYNEYMREIRTAHNWEKMFYADVFNLPGIFEY